MNYGCSQTTCIFFSHGSQSPYVTSGRRGVWREVVRRLLEGIGIGPPASSEGNGSWCDPNSWHWSISGLDEGSASDYSDLIKKEKSNKEYLVLLLLIMCLLCNLLLHDWYIGFLSSANCSCLVMAAWSNEVRRMLKSLWAQWKECHSWLVMSVRSCRMRVTPVIQLRKLAY